ncbi:ring-cleaving dioxygenase [Bradyrhizobium sp. PUT101]|uniref:ring-cleaving dioxygenase n=1 Tax=Bradyrhizobium sp. PUT101 TaxID=3447427 RepID=UPI003F826AC9
MDGIHVSARGLHHVTAIIGDVRRSSEFYGKVLGLKRVKKTVCYDDPGSYHLYYGNDAGSPGAVISTLAWNCVTPGMVGVGEVVQTAFRVPPGSLEGWSEKLKSQDIACRTEVSPFGERMVCTSDPDGTAIALVESAHGTAGDVGALTPSGLQGVTLDVREEDLTADILEDVFGFTPVARRERSVRFVTHDGAGGSLTLRTVGKSSRGRLGGGTIRHVAFRALDEADRSLMVEKLRSIYDISVSAPIERTYLTAVSFRAPCGVLFEIATDGPGFAVDEPAESLGERLMLPGFLEDRRQELQMILPPLD